MSATDGPFAETKEQLGGFTLIDVRNLNEAIARAERSPLARIGSMRCVRRGIPADLKAAPEESARDALDEIYRLHERAALILLSPLLQPIVARHCETSLRDRSCGLCRGSDIHAAKRPLRWQSIPRLTRNRAMKRFDRASARVGAIDSEAYRSFRERL